MIRVGIIGAGFMGNTHAKAYTNINSSKLVAICDKKEATVRKLADEYKCEYYTDVDLMLKEKEIDVIDICLPTFLHEEYVYRSAQASKNIICEKPITLDLEKLDGMIKEVEKNKVQLFVGQVLRFWPEYVKAKEMYDNGELGQLKYVFAARLSEHPKWSEWYKRPENSGGGLLDLHLHDIDFMCWLLGDVQSVYATGQKNQSGSWNYVSSILHFKSGVSATIQGVMEMENGYPFTMDLKLVGSKKTYEYIMRAGQNLEDINSSSRNIYIYDNGVVENYKFSEVDAYQVELGHFIECLENEKASDIIDIYQARKVLATIEALKESLETGNKVDL